MVLQHLKLIVLDEADEMLSRGFKDELDKILGLLTKAKAKWLFSATMPQGIKQIIREHLSKDAVQLQVSGRNVVNENINHRYIPSDDRDKLYRLTQLLKTTYPDQKGIIFCNTKKNVKLLSQQLTAQNLSVDVIHGDLLQKVRTETTSVLGLETREEEWK